MKFYFLFFVFCFLFFVDASFKKKIKVDYSADRIIYQNKKEILLLMGQAVLNVKNYQFRGKKIIVNKKENLTHCFGNANIINKTNREKYSSEIIVFNSKEKKIYGFLKDEKSEIVTLYYPSDIDNPQKISTIERKDLNIVCENFSLQLNGENSFFTNDVKIVLEENEKKKKKKKTVLDGDIAFYNSEKDIIELVAYSNKNVTTLTEEYYILSKKADLVASENFYFDKDVKLYSFENNKTNLTIFGDQLNIVLKKEIIFTNKLNKVEIKTNDILECHTNVVFHDLEEDNKIFGDYLNYNITSKDFYFSKKPILINKKKDFSIAANELDGNSEQEKMYGKGNVFLTNENNVVNGIVLKYEDKENLWVSGNVFIDKNKGKEKFTCDLVKYEIDSKKINMLGNVKAVIDQLKEE